MAANVEIVSVPKTSVGSQQTGAREKEFLNWLEEDSTTALVSESHGQYYAFCVEFGIAGSGASKDEAVDEAVKLLMSYLVFSFSEGRPYRETKKSPPILLRLRSWYLFIRARLLRRIKPLSRLGWLITVPTTSHDSGRLAH